MSMKYLFLNSYLNAREKHLADDIDFGRMINAETAEKAFEVLQDTDYGKWALDTEDPEEVFEKEKLFFRKDLKRIDASRPAELFSLKENIDNLRSVLKKEIFGTEIDEFDISEKEKDELLKNFKEEVEEAKKKKTPAELDDYLTEVHLERIKESAGKDKEVKRFVQRYKSALEDFSGKERDDRIRNLEDDFISENTKKNEGFSPIMAFFMKKWKAEKKIRTIIAGKRMGFEPAKIKELVNDLKSI